MVEIWPRISRQAGGRREQPHKGLPAAFCVCVCVCVLRLALLMVQSSIRWPRSYILRSLVRMATDCTSILRCLPFSYLPSVAYRGALPQMMMDAQRI